jgi:hypothetical protein
MQGHGICSDRRNRVRFATVDDNRISYGVPRISNQKNLPYKNQAGICCGSGGTAMLWRAICLSVVMSVASTSLATAAVRIVNDNGGQIGPYMDRLTTLRSSGEQVVIDGNCLSACTLVLGVIPRDRICVTRRARLGFHAAWRPDQSGRPIPSRAGTQMLMETYPTSIRGWIASRGGLTPKMIYLQGAQLRAMYSPCRDGVIAEARPGWTGAASDSGRGAGTPQPVREQRARAASQTR